MPGTFRHIVLFLGTLTSLTGLAQQRPVKPTPAEIDVAITYVAERAKIASIGCGCFWLEGGGMNAAVTFHRGLGVAANLTGGHASNIESGVDLDKVSFMMGPRYTHPFKNWFGHDFGRPGGGRIFGEGLIGGVHSFNTVVPTSAGVAAPQAPSCSRWEAAWICLFEKASAFAFSKLTMSAQPCPTAATAPKVICASQRAFRFISQTRQWQEAHARLQGSFAHLACRAERMK